MSYEPIENYALIGDMRTAALVGVDGSIDWLCIPHFDSPSVFARILDAGKGGFFAIRPVDADTTFKQFYWSDTNVLVTRFLSADGASELTDFMPLARSVDRAPDRRQVVRRVSAVRGAIALRMECRPAFNYARDAHEAERVESGAIFRTPELTLGLATAVPLSLEDGSAVAEFTLAEGESATFVLRELRDESGCGVCLSSHESEALFRETVAFWRGWLAQCSYKGRWRERVHRSALALKLLTFEPTGAIVAAPTCSLPERIGGARNWDYRYTWVRDSAFTIYAFLRLGFTEEAAAFMRFLTGLCGHSGNGRPLEVMYGIDGRTMLTEETLTHLDGYKGSRPVRIGNGASQQIQLDIYGELLDAIYLYNKNGSPISYDVWLAVERFVDWVCDRWQGTDEGIWEVRGAPQHFVYSKLMCWVAVDRGLRLAESRSFPANRERWLEVRDAIYEEIMSKGWSEQRQAFVQAYGSQTLDAANLMMPLVFFLSPSDPRLLSSLDATLKSPAHGGLTANSLVYRYDPAKTADGLRGGEGTFNICTFWLVEALTRAGRYDRQRLEDARIMFERMLGFANHVGLYAEETGRRGEGLGNFPQAFTHLALITAALNLDQVLGE